MPRLFAFFAALALVAAPAAAQSTTSAADAERFVQTNAQDVIATLQSLESGERDIASVKAEFREKITELADVERITNFVLGRYRRGADEADLAAFRETFREYAIGVYETELTNYAGQTFAVTGSVTRRPGDYVVQSVIRGDGDATEVNWRVQENGDGALKVLDAEVAGVWLAQTQREQITSIIGDARGDVGAATEALRERLDAGGDLEPLGG